MGTLDLKSAEFWDRSAVDTELRRVYDICSGCRRCLPLCPSFKVLFDRLDVDAVDGDVEKLPARDVSEVVDLCYQCKLCFNHCPYTPPHRWEVDFPRLMLRARAADARANGVRLQDRMLGNTELVGKLGRLAAPLSNWMNELAVHRAFVHAVAGIHKDRNLPRFHRQTFTRWFKARGHATTAGDASAAGAAPAGVTADRASAAGAPTARGTADRASAAGVPTGRAPAAYKVALFHTCTVEYNDPATGRAAVRVLERNRVDVSVPEQRCCGMPYLDGGAVDQAKALIRDNVKSLAAAVREGRTIVVPGPTCSYMLKQEYPWLEGGDDAKLVARNTRDLFEYLAELHAAGKLDTGFTRPVGAVTYHVPCHLRAQKIGHKSADVLRLIPGAEVEVVEKCSAVDGTWGFKKQYHELSLKLAQPLFDAITRADAPVTATDCPLAALQIAQGTGRQAKHPIRVLAAAYGLED
jgi:Fe-S oxidoreductase